jgi:hypothetical protein
MTTDLDDEIRSFMERGLRHVSAAEAIERTSHGAATFPAAGSRPRASRTRWTVIAAGTAAAACAAGLVASQLGAPGTRPQPHHSSSSILTAAYVRHLASASSVALAHAGRAVIVSRTTENGISQGTSTSDITFSGRNWNDSFREELPGSGGAAGPTQSAINRVVHGQAYDYFVADHGLAWYHDTGPNAVASMAIPDPRKLLSELSPAASFVRVGYTTVGGVKVAHLRATNLSGLPSLQLGNDTPAGRLTSLDIWVDSSAVVRRMSVSTSQTEPAGQSYLKLVPKNATGELKALRKRHPHLKILAQKSGRLIVEWTIDPAAAKPRVDRSSVVVSFLDIGQPQVIRPPAHAYQTHGVG